MAPVVIDHIPDFFRASFFRIGNVDKSHGAMIHNGQALGIHHLVDQKDLITQPLLKLAMI